MDIAYELFTYNNYNSSYAIYSALQYTALMEEES